MCVAFFTLEHPDYALILCSNRDEYLTRPTEFAHFHSFEAQGHLHDGISSDQQLPRQRPTQRPQDGDAVVLSGIDVQAGGTWLGLARTGKLALLTNITEDTTLKFPLSRGHLVTSFLTTPPSFLTDKHPDPTEVEQYLRGLVVPPDLEDGGGAIYAGFNLLLLIPRVTQSSTTPSPLLTYDAYLATNHGAGGEICCRLLSHAERQYGGLSNGSDGYGGKDWVKVKRGLEILRTVVNAPDHSEDKIIEELFELLTWMPPTPPTSRAELCNTIQVDPILLRVSGSSNIGAGAATTSLPPVILVKRTGEVVFVERDRWAQGEERKPVLASTSSQRVYRFKLDV
ncbi:NRDE protein-domain-containing protein [Pisolithus albus]|nr:NRDE protein-domain-containing protein [Pisolithus albus]